MKCLTNASKQAQRSSPGHGVNCHMKIKKPQVRFIIKIFLIKNECKIPYGCLTYPMGVLHSFSTKNIFIIKWT